MNIKLLIKDLMQENLDGLKISLTNEFNDLIGFLQEEVEKWLIHFVNKNEDQVDIIHQLGLELKEAKDEFFKPNIKHGLVASPL